MYRCDTYVWDIFAFTWTPYGPYTAMAGSGSYLRIERVTQGVSQTWNDDMRTLFQWGPLPLTLYNRFKAF